MKDTDEEDIHEENNDDHECGSCGGKYTLSFVVTEENHGIEHQFCPFCGDLKSEEELPSGVFGDEEG